MLVLHHPATLDHCIIEILNGKVIPAYECPQRISTILNTLEVEGRHELRDTSKNRQNGEILSEEGPGQEGTWLSATTPVLTRRFIAESHDPGYVEYLKTIHHEWLSFLHTAISSPREPKDILALSRPPGHHCTTEMAGGYCYLNNSVLAVHALRHFHATGPGHDSVGAPPKIAILDLDFHHGNGTQDYFYRDPSVLYVSLHGKDEYPYYTGFEDEKGDGPGKGSTWNFPLSVRTSAEVYIATLRRAMGIISESKPTYLVVSLGFDTYRMDPLGSFAIDTEDYETIARTVSSDLSLKGVPAVILLEGGYVLEALGQNVGSFLRGGRRAELKDSEVKKNQRQ
ncbi:unnamed protein product [Parascedosporium putredinis]|uniref:Histone deacetylase domain-containing protein n=1 Tax=Parascedosporium putredinis TaxID=1442378 RepID=A0A9P1M7T0_9PEZI|nr:unnamed protein product [Parascedosporium putredinis]CAI7988003.1 unnamed protein product [Parascedosporium putredinis]